MSDQQVVVNSVTYTHVGVLKTHDQRTVIAESAWRDDEGLIVGQLAYMLDRIIGLEKELIASRAELARVREQIGYVRQVCVMASQQTNNDDALTCYANLEAIYAPPNADPGAANG